MNENDEKDDLIKKLQWDLQNCSDDFEIATACIDEFKHRLFEIMYALDKASAEKDFITLRRWHYENMDWLRDEDMITEYYDFVHDVRENEAKHEKN